MKILVLGIGQSLRGDDAAGLEAVHLWLTRYPESAAEVRVEYSELPGLSLLELFEDQEAAIIVDAVQASASAGRVIYLDTTGLASFSPGTGSGHGWGVAETLQMGRSLYPWLEKCQITLIGIVGKDFKMGTGLSLEVRKGLEEAADLLEREIQIMSLKSQPRPSH
jgi:hydrogenase maturation protease